MTNIHMQARFGYGLFPRPQQRCAKREQRKFAYYAEPKQRHRR